MSHAPISRDPGLQPERTALAWGRTAMLVLLNAVLVIRAGWAHDRTPMTLLGLSLLLAAALLFGYGSLRKHVLVTRQTHAAPHPFAPLGVAGATAIVCLIQVAQLLSRLLHS